MRAQIKAEPLLRLIFQTCNHYKKHYCYPSQRTLMKWLNAYYDIEISIATINRWLLAAQGLGFIVRQRRIKRDPRRGMMFKSTMYFITIKGLHHLRRLGYNVVESLKRLLGFFRVGKRNANYAAGGGLSTGYHKSTFSPSDRSKILPAEG